MCLADAGEWTWMSGSNTSFPVGVYGEKGIPDSANEPSNRYRSISWIDSEGNLWLFGGWTFNADPSRRGALSDLWRYEPDTDQWTWMSGSNIVNQSGVYGTKGTPDEDNVPGARSDSISWVDTSGNLWLFGGYGRDNAGTNSYLNDLWRYEPDTNQWTWMSGSNIVNRPGVYGEKGTSDAANMPGSRNKSISWTDSAGNFWLFGGSGYDSVRNGILNDIWRYEPDTEMWTWVSGSSTRNQIGVYGEKGTADAANVPGARYESISWIDNDDNLWLFGGRGWDSVGGDSYLRLNDLWRYDPDTDMWTWLSGSDSGNVGTTFGEKGTPDETNMPGARQVSISWIDSVGNLWLFGGIVWDSEAARTFRMNDLWSYDPVADIWTWVSGSNEGYQASVYGSKGTPAPGNVPGAREASNSWLGTDGNLWLFGGASTTGAADLWRYELPECVGDSDCDDGDFCNGLETCDNSTCVASENPCDNSTLLCDEDNDTCVECLDSTDCDDDGLYCSGEPICDDGMCDLAGNPCDNSTQFCDETNDICVECFNDSDCEDDGLYCTGDPICDEGLCDLTGNPCDNATSVCDEFGESCVECVDDSDCAETDICRDTVCVSGCELFIEYKKIKAEKLSKPRKRTFKITGDENFDPYGIIEFEPFEVIRSKVTTKKHILKIKALVPADLEPGFITISVGDCSGEIEIIGETR